MTKTKKKPSSKRRFVAMYRQQLEFFHANEPIVGICTGIGAGKSRTGATRVLLTAQNGESHLALSPSYVMLRKSTLPLMTKVARELGILKKTIISPFPVVTFQTQDGGMAECVFGSTDQPENLRGSNNDSLWLDEASLMPKSAFDISIGRLRGIRGQMGVVLMTFTPRGRKNWTFNVFYEESKETPRGDAEAAMMGLEKIGQTWYKRKDGTRLIQASSRDNPFISEAYYNNLKRLYSTQFAEQELEGRFVDIIGLMFKREWFLNKMRDMAPRDARRLRYWDLAATEFDGCYTSGVLLAQTADRQIFVEDVVRGQWSTMTRNYMIKETADRDARRYNNEVAQVFEQEPGSGGKEQAQQMVRMLAGRPVYRDLPSKGGSQRSRDGEKLPGAAKVYRAQPFAAQCEAGNVYLVSGDWTDEWLSELTAFPEMAYCDQVDSTSAAYNRLEATRVAVPGELGTISAVSTISNRYGVFSPGARDNTPTFLGRN